MADFTVIRPGARVGLWDGEVADARVLTVQIRLGGYLTYEVAFWRDGDRLTAWVEAFEIDPDPPPLGVIGFRGDDGPD